MAAGRIYKAVLAGCAGALTGLAAWFLPSRRVTPAQRERARRLAVNAKGRPGSASITDFHDSIVWYTYEVGGVEYAACQDVSTLADFLPPDPVRRIERPATFKYLPRNPANSIVICEEWSGLRFRPRVTAP